MKNVSTAFREQVKNGAIIYPYADVTLSDGSTLALSPEKNFRVTGNSITQTAGNNSFPLGAAISKTLKLTIDNSDGSFDGRDFLAAKITLKSGVILADGTTEKIKDGTFYVTDPVAPGSTLVLTAADAIFKTSVSYIPGVTYPATLFRIYQDVCRQCNLIIGSASFSNQDFLVEEAPENVTCRSVLANIAMIAGGNALCDENERVVIKSYNMDGIKKADGSYNTDGFQVFEDFKSTPEVSTDPIKITGVRTTVETDDWKDSELIIGDTQYCFSVDNPLIVGKESDGLQLIANSVIGLELYSFSGSHIAYPMAEVMDTCFVRKNNGSVFPTVLTSVEFNYLSFTNLKCDLDTPERTASSYGGKAAEIYQKMKRITQRHYTEFEKQMNSLSERLDNSSGVYMTTEEQSDGSNIYYLHDKPTLKESQIVWKMTAEAVAVSSDGGKTWNAGLTVDGTLISKIMTTIGINFDWGVGGELVIQDESGRETLYVNAETGEVRISASAVSIKGEDIDTFISRLSKKNLDDFIDGEYADNIKDIENSLDKKAESWYQENDPSIEWTATEETYLLDSDGENILDGNGNPFLTVWEKEKSTHDGDLWKVPSTGDEFIYISGNWVKSKVPDDLFDFIDGKAQIFVNTPVPPYNVGDLWFGGADADIMTCIRDRQDGEFSADDWEKKNKYTDDSAVDELNTALDQEEIFNRLTNNGEEQGIYLLNRKLYINFSFARGGILKLGGKNNGNGEFHVYDENDELIGSWTNKGFSIDKAESVKLGDFFNYDSNGNINGQADVFITMGGWQIKQTTVYDEPAEYWETIGTQENGIGAKGPWVVWGGWNGIGAFNKDNYNFVVTEDGTCKAMSWVTGSKAEWKEDIHAYEDGALEKINNTTVYRYKLKRHSKDDDGRHIGFVIGDGFDLTGDILDHDKSNIDMYNALGVAYKAIQELSKEVSKLKEKLKRYESEEQACRNSKNIQKNQNSKTTIFRF